jgi:hypothetical protein
MPDLYSNVRRANSNYTPQYTGSNTDTIKSVADTLQLRSLQNQNAIDDKLVAAINEQYAPGDEAIGQKIYEDISGMRDQIASSDQGFENSTGLVRNLVRDKFLTNRDRIEGLRNQKLFKAFEDKRLNLGTRGEIFGPEWRGTKNPDGSYNKFETTVEERLDWDKRGESIFNQMEADLIASGYKADPNNPDYLKSIITGGINDTKIADVAKAGLARFKESDEGKQYIKTLQRDNNGITQDQINEKVYNNLVNIGLERKHSIRQEKLEQLNQYALRAKYENNQEPLPPYTPTSPTAPATNSYQKDLSTEAGDIQYDERQGKWFKVGIPKGWTPTGPGAQPPTVQLEEVPDPNSNQPGTTSYQFNKLLNQDPELLQKAGIKDYKTFLSTYNEAKKKNASIAVSALRIDPEQAKIYTDDLKNNLQSLTIYPADSPNGVSAEEAGVEYDDAGKPRVALVKIVPSLPNSSLEGGGAEILLERKGKAPIKAFVELNDAYTQQTKWLNKVLGSSTYASQDLNDIDKPLVNDDPYSIRRDADGNVYQDIVYTLTIPTPNSKRAFTSKVKQGIRISTPDGQYQDLFGKDAEELFEDKKFPTVSDEEFQAEQAQKAKQRLSGGFNTAETLKRKRGG